jgi:Arc/MetJ family transcription regulator
VTQGSVWRCTMATNLAIDDALIVEAQAIGGAATKKAAVTEALKEYIQRRKQVQILSLFGKIEYDPDYDYKRIRARG